MRHLGGHKWYRQRYRVGDFGSAVRRVGMPKMEVATTSHHGGAIGFARAKDALKTEGGEATAQAPQGREKKGDEMDRLRLVRRSKTSR